MKQQDNNMQPSSIRENKILLFANQKGGVGKTTLCGLFANYLAVNQRVPLLVRCGSTTNFLWPTEG